ncbi:uncharacterized protein LOC116124420 [Pistacia vera]|uniref:uncharacterized protein LOC116124420 n=1 Tax=Pistacia vera TaxID=55513 RepID=UPI001263844D|nr:uncharacterized protein LOC116124420 [Pistacia vera]
MPLLTSAQPFNVLPSYPSFCYSYNGQLTGRKDQKSPEEVMDIELADSWIAPIVKYLEHNELSIDKNEARCLRAKVVRFTIYKGQLLRKSFSGPYLKAISPEEAKRVLAELHKGKCGNHAGGRNLAHQVITVGYYWPTICTDSATYAKKCDSCQRFTHVSHLPPE